MKITVEKVAHKDAVRVIFDETIHASFFREKNNRSELVIKITKRKELSRRKWFLLVREVVTLAKKHHLSRVVLDWSSLTNFPVLRKDSSETLALLVSENLLLASYEFTQYKKKEKKSYQGLSQVIVLVDAESISSVKQGIQTGVVRGEYMNWYRTLANIPGNDMTPKLLAREVKRAVAKAKNNKLSLKILGQKEIERLGMGGVMAVGKGSKEESQFIELVYRGGRKSEAPIALVGKGVTFDSGGIDTKPHPYALDMMMDMSGGGAVLATILISARLGIKRNLVALVPAVENMPGGESFRPGDVVNMLDGTTVEIGHTDAEGRLILGDAITYAKRFKPAGVLDVATLTGAAGVALGERATALFTRDDVQAEKILRAGEMTGDLAWRLPLWEEYESEIVGNVADISNVRTKGRDGVGGAITAATFLYHFGKSYDWFVHLDMAPTMTSVFDEHLARGAKGSPVRLLVEWLEKM